MHNIYGALFFQDDISVNLNNYGILNARVGLRLDTDSYMLKVTPGYRFSLTYEAPYYAKDFATQATLGINRYYGRNIFAYALADGLKKLESSLKRDNPNVTWESILESNRQCANANDSNCITGYGVDFMKFSKLNVPYVNEYMIGFLQDIKNFSISLKYIYRQGRDEVRLVSSDVANLPADSNYQNTYYTYTNEGKSQSHIITLLINNTKPLEFYNVKNYFLFAFDFTHTQRNFRDYADSITAPQLQNQFISYNGVLMRYAERPADNFIKPYTFRLETTHTYEVWRARMLWNNFFRLRSSYDAMVSITAGSDGADSFEINGVMTSVDTFKPYRVDMAFTWDMRFGLEFDVGRGNKFFTNLDIYNILDSKNIAIANLSYSSNAGLSATPIYEVGRQFWLEMGYRF